jgi:hypothetical protein
MNKRVCALTAGLALLALAGCGGEGGGRRQVSGTVNYDGQPVAAGRITFSPDASKQNSGPQGFAEIRDGKFDTRRGGKGGPGGPVVVKVEAFDGQPAEGRPLGALLFTYETKVELPQDNATHDFAIRPDQVIKAPPATAQGP